jgi:hypothetical protein
VQISRQFLTVLGRAKAEFDNGGNKAIISRNSKRLDCGETDGKRQRGIEYQSLHFIRGFVGIMTEQADCQERGLIVAQSEPGDKFIEPRAVVAASQGQRRREPDVVVAIAKRIHQRVAGYGIVEKSKPLDGDHAPAPRKRAELAPEPIRDTEFGRLCDKSGALYTTDKLDEVEGQLRHDGIPYPLDSAGRCRGSLQQKWCEPTPRGKQALASPGRDGAKKDEQRHHGDSGTGEE